jgi:superfamily II DNA or RNA helicase
VSSDERLNRNLANEAPGALGSEEPEHARRTKVRMNSKGSTQIGATYASQSSDDENDALTDDLFTALDVTGDEDIDADGAPAVDALLPDEAERAPYALPYTPHLTLTPRPYQRTAVDAWLRADGCGVVVLPTGAGKTVVAFDAIARMSVRTLVVVPTIELLRQWRSELTTRLGLDDGAVGCVGGGERTVGPITVITYDSAAMPRRKLDGFGLLVFDEAHHLPANSYRAIVAKARAPWRLGLSATLERADERHLDLATLIGPVVYERAAEELAAEKHIAAFTERRVFVDLTPEEEMRYEGLMAEWKYYLATRRAQLGGGPGMFTQLIRRSGYDPEARRALRAHHEARLLAMNATAKTGTIEQLLRRHPNEKVIIFSEYVEMVDRISRALLLPAITYRTPPAERKAILAGFRSGELTKLVTGRDARVCAAAGAGVASQARGRYALRADLAPHQRARHRAQTASRAQAARNATIIPDPGVIAPCSS